MRQCGDCTLCCKLLAVPPLGKLAGQRCKYQRHTGCKVYRTHTMPPECSIWNCRWLVNDDTADLSRPDRSHYVIDIMPDFITASNNDTGEQFKIQVVQVWVDPRYPEAHRDPALRAYLERRAHEGIAALIRYDASNAFPLFAPPMTGGLWVEERQRGVSEGRSHSFAEIQRALGPAKITTD